MNTTIYQIVSGRPGARIFATLTLLFAAHVASAETRTSTWNPFAATGLMSATHPWANLNVYRLWSKLAPRMVETHYDGRPGVFAQASRDDAGHVTILLAHLRYRKDASVPLTVELPGVTARRCITHYVVDGEHSNAFDAGPEHAELETVPPPNLADGKLTVILRPRSVHLLALDPGP